MGIYFLMTDIKDILLQFEDYLKINTNSSITTIKKYKSIVRLFLLSTDLRLTLTKINEWISTKNRTKNTYVYKYALRHFLLSIGKKSWAESLVVAKRSKRKKVFKYISKSNVQQILNGLDKKFQGVALLQYKTGVRYSEAITIRAESIDFDINPTFITIQLGKDKSLTKGSKERTINIHKKYEPYIRRYLKRPYGYLFIPERCEDMSQEKLRGYINNLLITYNENLRKIGNYYHVDALSSHYLRHLFSDNFLKAGGDPVFLQKALGHSDIRTTMGYVSIQSQMVEKALLNMEGD